MIICAAIKFSNGVIVRGHRHNHCLSAASGMDSVTLGDVKGSIQGFMTGENKFVDRTEAKIIAIKSQQAIASHDPIELYSEDLY